MKGSMNNSFLIRNNLYESIRENMHLVWDKKMWANIF